LISTVVMFQAQNGETINSTRKVAVSFKIIMTTSVTIPCFTKQYQTCKTKTKTAVCKDQDQDRRSQTTSLDCVKQPSTFGFGFGLAGLFSRRSL